MKKIIAITVVVALLLAMAVSTPVTAKPGTIHVPDDYVTIQEAVNAASAGDVIFIGSGTYNENVTVNKSVSIKGAGSPRTTVQSPNGNTVFTVVASNVCISGFTITGASNVWQSGIQISGADNVSISKNIIELNGNGITISNSDGTSIINNVVRYNDAPLASPQARIDNGNGIIVWDSGGGADLDILIKSNRTYYNYKFGIFVGGAANMNADGTEINGNKLYHNGAYWNIGAGDRNWLGMGFMNAMGTISVGGNNIFPTTSGLDYWVSNSPGLVLGGTPSYSGIPVPPIP